MKNTSYFYEIHDLLTQFIAAFDDCIIKRYDKNRVAKELIEVRYVMAPKQRVMYDIVNKAQNLTLPVVAINLNSLSRDESRVFNKLSDVYLPATSTEYPRKAAKIPPPIPVNLEVSMSILARYMSDVDQIISNFVPYNNPYIILSWPLPEEYGTAYTQEIRSEVLWSGSLSYSTPTDTTYTDKFRIVVDTTFTIKGWLFREARDPQAIIYKIDANFHALDLANKIYTLDDYNTLSAYNTGDRSFTDTVTVSGVPTFTNIFYATTGTYFPIYGGTTIRRDIVNNFILYGTRFSYNNTFYLSANTPNFASNFTEIDTAKSPTISAYKLDPNYYSVISDGVVNISIPENYLQTGQFTFITANSAGWSTTYNASSSIITTV